MNDWRGNAHPQNTASAYLFGAICPARGTGARLVMPRCTTSAMNLYLAEIAKAVAPRCTRRTATRSGGLAHDPVVQDPCQHTLLPLPARSPEPNPLENLWQFMRENWLGNRIFASYEAILDHCCDAWNRIIDQPWRIMSLGLRQWTHGS